MQEISGVQSLDNFWNNGTHTVQQLTDKIDNDYISKWKEEISKEKTASGDNNKLRTYNKFKTNFRMENYLSCIMIRIIGNLLVN